MRRRIEEQNYIDCLDGVWRIIFHGRLVYVHHTSARGRPWAWLAELLTNPGRVYSATELVRAVGLGCPQTGCSLSIFTLGENPQNEPFVVHLRDALQTFQGYPGMIEDPEDPEYEPPSWVAEPFCYSPAIPTRWESRHYQASSEGGS